MIKNIASHILTHYLTPAIINYINIIMYKVSTFHFGFVERFSNVPRIKLNCAIVIIGGTLFFSGWWIMIDLNAVNPDLLNEKRVYHVPGVFATLSMLIVNIVPLNILRNAYMTDDKWRVLVATLILFIGLVMTFGSLIGAAYILVHDYILDTDKNIWPGIAIFLQNFFIFGSNLLIKFGTRSEAF